MSFLVSLLLAYQPVKALGNLNISVQEGLAGAERIFNLLDTSNYLLENEKQDLDSIKISNIELPEGVKPTIIDRDFVVATLVPPTVEVETKPAEAEDEASEEGKEEKAEDKKEDKKEENKEEQKEESK